MDTELDCQVLVVGAGVSGIGAGIALAKHGLPDFLILEKADEVGGTWRDHIYPGLTVDVPALVYSFSFEQKPDWSSMWATQQEIFDYLRDCADKYGVRPRIRFGQEVIDASYDSERNRWQTRVKDGGVYRSRYLVNAAVISARPAGPTSTASMASRAR